MDLFWFQRAHNKKLPHPFFFIPFPCNLSKLSVFMCTVISCLLIYLVIDLTKHNTTNYIPLEPEPMRNEHGQCISPWFLSCIVVTAQRWLPCPSVKELCHRHTLSFSFSPSEPSFQRKNCGADTSGLAYPAVHAVCSQSVKMYPWQLPVLEYAHRTLVYHVT